MKIIKVLVFVLRSFLVLSIFSITTINVSWSSEGSDLTVTDKLTHQLFNLFFHKQAHILPSRPDDVRSGIEIESTKRLKCDAVSFSPQRMYKTLRGDTAKIDRAYLNFINLNTCTKCEAFSTGFGIDEMRWDEDSHHVREASPYLWLSIEKNRFPIDPRSGSRYLLQGRDLMDDYYFDTPEFLAINNGYTIRGRRRWQNWEPFDKPQLQRLLVAFKRMFGVSHPLSS
ncbi:MAG: hypothetical protein HON90_08315 [Halobacteriovoraceae bacterium]|jgi:hypothetical protein|nr:hypothetical protein [Halobacteriovoraceae bacterium]